MMNATNSRRVALIACVVLGACANEKTAQVDSTKPAVVSASRPGDSARAWTARPTKNYLTCSPSVVGPDSIVVLRMQTPHGSSLHIGGPDGTPYLVVFHGQGSPDRGGRKSLMSPDAFAGLTELRLAVRSLTGGVWIFGRDTNQVVFRTPGTYRVRVGNDMETDGPDYAECLLTYRPS
jgi:hypothetical protein